MVGNGYVEGRTFEYFVFSDGRLRDIQLGSESSYFLYFLFGDWEERGGRGVLTIEK